MAGLPRRQRVGAYAVIVRHDHILLTRLAPHITRGELWTLPGGGLDHGEDPRDAVLREIREETGLEAQVGETARVYSAHLPATWRDGRRVDAHALRIVYDGWVAPDAPEPQVLEVGGSTVAAAWHPVAGVMDGSVPVAALVREALADHRPFRRQRVAAYALCVRGSGDAAEVLLTRISALGAHAGSWTLPGGGIDHGEPPRSAVLREVREETGLECEVGELLDVHDVHFDGVAPTGRFEDYHGLHLVFAATVSGGEPRVAEVDGTTAEAAWVPVIAVADGSCEVLDVVRHALAVAGEG
ncbi:NUDIX hydrolase [Nocardioides taihuensis]|uniref:NUDIX hydrolase n=1 Tax=Nocardioides taihuensis TaxID=1835606 RepID=A0ABW0BIJ9_9ACTN